MILPYDPPSPDSAPSTPRRPQRDSSSSPSNGTSIHDTDIDAGDEMKGAMHRWFSDGEGRKLQKSNGRKAARQNDQNDKTPALGFPSSGTSVLGSSPTLHDNNHAPSRTNIVTPGKEYWKGFDSVESGIEGSPCEEHADYKDVGPPRYGFPPLDNEKDGFSAPPDIEDDDIYSHAAMSIRAEQILANAKKRLTVCLLSKSLQNCVTTNGLRIWREISIGREVPFTTDHLLQCLPSRIAPQILSRSILFH